MSSGGIEKDPDVVRLRQEARDLLVTSLAKRGYTDAQSVHRAMMRERRERGERAYEVPPRTLQRYMSEGPPLAPKDATRTSLYALGDFAGIRPEFEAALQRLWARRQRNERDNAIRQSTEDRQALPPMWYQVIPVQNSRPYPSIDVITIERQRGREFRGRRGPCLASA